MIDARESLLSTPTAPSPRRPAAASRRAGSNLSKSRAKHLKIVRQFSDAKVKPFDQIEWEFRKAEITDDGGKVIFKQDKVEVPKSWSVLATKVVVSKYFYGEQNTPERETSVRQLIHRVCRTMADWGVKDGYFSPEDGEVFYDELTWLCVNQYGAFNSPVWFNVGLFTEYAVGKDSARGNWFYNRQTGQGERARTQYEYPQGSACFIQSVQDNMEDIMRLAYSEARLFKYGSGTGTDLTPIRSSKEKLSGGGRPSGPLSFLKVYDQVANVVKSGGKTAPRRKNELHQSAGTGTATSRSSLTRSRKEEKKAWCLIETGLRRLLQRRRLRERDVSEREPVRAGQRRVHAGGARPKRVVDAEGHGRTKPAGEKEEARGLLMKIAEGTHICGDPGLPVRRSDPKVAHVQGHRADPFDQSLLGIRFSEQHGVQPRLVEPDEVQAGRRGFRPRAVSRRPVRIFITAQENMVDNASGYPTRRKSRRTRTSSAPWVSASPISARSS